MSESYVTPEASVWSDKITELDRFVFVTPEYNKGITSEAPMLKI
ncbi:NAD(P)H-dependent oxidoreductase [Mammaliicoccus sciuri]